MARKKEGKKEKFHDHKTNPENTEKKKCLREWF